MPETKDLYLKKARQEDWRAMYYNLWSHPESARYMLWDVTTSEEDAKARMERTIAFQASHAYHWTVYEKASGQAIGFAGLRILEPRVCEETGIAVGPAFTGKGYGKQILNALADFAKKELGAKRLLGCCRSENAASRGMQLSCGFRFSHCEEKVDPRNDMPYTMEYYYKELE